MRADYYNFIYNEKKKVVFAYVPKVACSNWKAVMRHLAGAENHLDTAYAHNRKTSGLVYLDQVPERRKILQHGNIARFACVRNPYSRVLSAYLNKIEARLPPCSDPRNGDHFDRVVADIEAFRTTPPGPLAAAGQITFGVFLEWLAAGASHFTRDEHWQGQFELLGRGTVRFDFIGRFETLAVDARHILDRMGCNLAFPSQSQIRFAPTGADAKVARYYTPFCRNLVSIIYKSDFSAFGYETNVTH